MKNHRLQKNIPFLVKAFATTSLVALCLPAFANPQGGNVVGGAATIVETGNTVDINVQTQNAVIDWQGFDIGVGEITNFQQLSSSSTVVNRIQSENPSFIFGQLNANGNVVLTNPNGVMFGQSARVDVHGLVASTSVMDAVTPFMDDGLIRLNQTSHHNGVVINNGLITAGEAGLVGLVAPHVENNGIITAHLGRVHLASGDTATVDFYGDGLIEVAVSDVVTSQSIINTGGIYADGGLIALTAAAGKNIVDRLIVVSGELKAPSFKEEQGKIIIYGEDVSTVFVDAVIDVSGNDAGQIGGTVDILGEQIAILNGAVINANGDRGGGDTKIGGDYLGAGETPTAKIVYVQDQVLIMSDAHTRGNGGRVIVWADDTTTFQGNIFARGGVDGGNGGFSETSGKKNLKATGFVDLTARHHSGHKGSYLLDPEDITIYGNFLPTDIAGNILWLDGSDQTTIIDDNGANANSVSFDGSVATWVDKSGQGNDVSNASGAGQPSYNSNAKNGEGAVEFNGSNSLYAQDSDVPSLDLSSNGFSYFSVVNPATTQGQQALINKENSYQIIIKNGRFQSAVETQGSGRTSFSGTTSITNQWQQMGFQYADTALNFFQNGELVQTMAPENNEVGNIVPTDGIFSIGGRGDPSPTRSFFAGEMAEILMYDRAIDASSKNLLDQYQSSKWRTPLKTPNTGYGEFTTRYLERLSETADIQLHASNSITLDLKGDALVLAQDKNISLTTVNGDIFSISGGSITTERLHNGGNITMSAGEIGNIDLSEMNLYAQNNGGINLDVDMGSLAYHQNYVEPVILPETVVTRTPEQITGITTPSYETAFSDLETLVSFSSDFEGGTLLQEEEIE